MQDGGAELLIHQDGGVLLWRPACDTGLKTVVDHLFGIGDFSRLHGAQRSFPAEHLRLEGFALIEGQDVQGLVETDAHDDLSLQQNPQNRSSFSPTCQLGASSVSLWRLLTPRTTSIGRRRRRSEEHT